jgi:phytoene dehydrogenase-like protein
VIGSGPNGLAAAITMARAGRSVLVREAQETIGGGARSAELTLPGFVHDVCSSIHPFVPGSPYFRSLPLAEHGLEMAESPGVVAHPFDDGSAVVLERSIDATAEQLGEDGDSYRRLMAPLARDWDKLEEAVLAPLVRAPRHPLALARFSLPALRSADGLARTLFRTERARALLVGCAAHSIVPLTRMATASFGLVLAVSGHRFGWPFPRGGAQTITDAAAAYLKTLGGVVEAGAPVRSLAELPRARAVFCDVAPRAFVRLAGDRLPSSYRRRLLRFRQGPGAFKLDYALDAPIPWKAEECRRAATVHLGATLDELVASEEAPWRAAHAERPFVLLAQHSLFDESRSPAGKHTVWAYCHLPNGSVREMTDRIERQIERFAPGFRDVVLARNALPPNELERRNENLVGGDINGGAADFWQLIFRPTARFVPYATPLEGVYLCSASTPPGGGVHGMCGYLAARSALRDAL